MRPKYVFFPLKNNTNIFGSFIYFLNEFFFFSSVLNEQTLFLFFLLFVNKFTRWIWIIFSIFFLHFPAYSQYFIFLCLIYGGMEIYVREIRYCCCHMCVYCWWDVSLETRTKKKLLPHFYWGCCDINILSTNAGVWYLLWCLFMLFHVNILYFGYIIKSSAFFYLTLYFPFH